MLCIQAIEGCQLHDGSYLCVSNADSTGDMQIADSVNHTKDGVCTTGISAGGSTGLAEDTWREEFKPWPLGLYNII